MFDVKTLTLSEAKNILKSLRRYADISKKVGKRGKDIFRNTSSGVSQYTVEYFPVVDEDFIYSKSLEVFEKFFAAHPTREEIRFIKKDSLLWGMKVYKDDNLVDMSFSRVVDKLKI